jgi:Ni/Fe-hydrogenase subunit HybB-like protein
MKSDTERLAPVGGPLWTPAFRALSLLVGFAMFVVIWRFAFGLGAASAMNDGFTWGSWKILNVVVFTALGSGGYAMALLVYVLNRGHYHAMVRPAILTSAVGYSTAVLALGVDIGRPWNFWQLANVFAWNLHSVLLEIAICVTLYLGFLWIEMAPPILETWRQSAHGRLKDFAIRVTPMLETAFPWMVAAALLLPTMHQSSLGSLFLLAGPRLHELWQTPLLPLFFLISCYALGYATVVMTVMLSGLRWRRPLQMPMLSRLSWVMAYVLIAFVTLRVLDLGARGALGSIVLMDRYGLFFLVETGLLVAAAVGLLRPSVRADAGSLFRMAMLIVLGGALYRLNASLIGFMPGDNWSYFPSVLELAVSFGFIALAVMGYIYIVKRFPILTTGPEPELVPVPSTERVGGYDG